MNKEPRVGVGVFIVNSKNEVLVGKRIGRNGGQQWALPGGHLDFGESWSACGAREVEEETGLKLEEPPSFVSVVNSVYDGRHYITIFTRSKAPEGQEAQNTEPDKCEGWKWVAWPDVPRPVFAPLARLLESGFSPLLIEKGRPEVAFDAQV